MTFDQNRRMFKFKDKWYDVSADEYLKNWHLKIKDKSITLDSVTEKELDGAKIDVKL